MTTKKCSKKGRKHTPIVSKKQRGFFGAELARKEAGKKTRTKMSQAELKKHLKESKGKKLPSKVVKKKKILVKKRRKTKMINRFGMKV